MYMAAVFTTVALVCRTSVDGATGWSVGHLQRVGAGRRLQQLDVVAVACDWRTQTYSIVTVNVFRAFTSNELTSRHSSHHDIGLQSRRNWPHSFINLYNCINNCQLSFTHCARQVPWECRSGYLCSLRHLSSAEQLNGAGQCRRNQCLVLELLMYLQFTHNGAHGLCLWLLINQPGHAKPYFRRRRHRASRRIRV